MAHIFWWLFERFLGDSLWKLRTFFLLHPGNQLLKMWHPKTLGVRVLKVSKHACNCQSYFWPGISADRKLPSIELPTSLKSMTLYAKHFHRGYQNWIASHRWEIEFSKWRRRAEKLGVINQEFKVWRCKKKKTSWSCFWAFSYFKLCISLIRSNSQIAELEISSYLMLIISP